MSEDITLADLFTEVLDAHRAQIFTALPGAVVGYDATEQTADVQPQVQDHTLDTDGAVVARRFPVLPRVPVMRLTGGGFFAGAPVAVGDTGLLVFCTLPIDRWRSTGQETAPNDTRRHSVTSAVFVPGLLTALSQVPELAANADLVLGRSGGSVLRIKPDDSVEIGHNPTDYAALAAKVDTLFTTFYTLFSGWTPVALDGGLALKTAFTAAFPTPPASVAAAQVKIK